MPHPDPHSIDNKLLITQATKIENLEHWLRNLLAVIHRDGGHYAEKYGLEKASVDAEDVVLTLRGEQLSAIDWDQVKKLVHADHVREMREVLIGRHVTSDKSPDSKDYRRQ